MLNINPISRNLNIKFGEPLFWKICLYCCFYLLPHFCSLEFCLLVGFMQESLKPLVRQIGVVLSQTKWWHPDLYRAQELQSATSTWSNEATTFSPFLSSGSHRFLSNTLSNTCDTWSDKWTVWRPSVSPCLNNSKAWVKKKYINSRPNVISQMAMDSFASPLGACIHSLPRLRCWLRSLLNKIMKKTKLIFGIPSF